MLHSSCIPTWRPWNSLTESLFRSFKSIEVAQNFSKAKTKVKVKLTSDSGYSPPEFTSARLTVILVLECVSVVHLHEISIYLRGWCFESCKCTIWYAPEKLKVFISLLFGWMMGFFVVADYLLSLLVLIWRFILFDE